MLTTASMPLGIERRLLTVEEFHNWRISASFIAAIPSNSSKEFHFIAMAVRGKSRLKSFSECLKPASSGLMKQPASLGIDYAGYTSVKKLGSADQISPANVPDFTLRVAQVL